MNARTAITEIDLAVYHLAEAGRLERMAERERLTAAKCLAAAHLFFNEALKRTETKIK